MDKKPIVYIRPVAVADLPEQARAQAPGDTVYAIHDETGARLALVAEWRMAFELAREHSMAPVSAH